LVTVKKTIEEIYDEDFELVKGSVHTLISEQDINLQKVHTRNWGQIVSHEYNFTKQQESIDTLKTVTRDDFKNSFLDTFFSENTKRVDFELDSKAKEELVKENVEFAAKNQEHAVYQPAKGRGPATTMDDFKNNTKYHDDKVLAGYKKFRESKQ
jgi:secreted Zn-dependent insulinase-like peptidase